MTARELIERLSEFDLDRPIVFQAWNPDDRKVDIAEVFEADEIQCYLGGYVCVAVEVS